MMQRGIELRFMNKSVIARTSVLVGAAAVSMTLLPAPASAESTGNCGQSWADWTNPTFRSKGWVDGWRETLMSIDENHKAVWSILGFGSANGVDKVDIFPDGNSWKAQFNTDFGNGHGKMYTIELRAESCSRGVDSAKVTVRDFDNKVPVHTGSVTRF
jgi:hypothetical protein